MNEDKVDNKFSSKIDGAGMVFNGGAETFPAGFRKVRKKPVPTANYWGELCWGQIVRGRTTIKGGNFVGGLKADYNNWRLNVANNPGLNFFPKFVGRLNVCKTFKNKLAPAGAQPGSHNHPSSLAIANACEVQNFHTKARNALESLSNATMQITNNILTVQMINQIKGTITD
uniref:Uncharacterized protein n=1 Tax=Romanomermis culicivorax TaxID=13658 RepID=A0A915KFJ2_ROMCU